MTQARRSKVFLRLLPRPDRQAESTDLELVDNVIDLATLAGIGFPTALLLGDRG